MTEQIKTGEQVMRAALEYIVKGDFSIEPYEIEAEAMRRIADEALEEADEAAENSVFELAYNAGYSASRKVFLKGFDEMCDEIREQLRKTFAGYKPRVQAVNRVQNLTHKLMENGK